MEATAKTSSHADIAAESSADESDAGSPPQKNTHPATSTAAQSAERPHPQAKANPGEGGGGLGKLGRKMKDRWTATTHEERERARQLRAQEEQEAYRRYTDIRSAMTRAVQTGQPQLLGKNAEGQDIYIEPPSTDPYGDHVYPGPYGAGDGPYQAYNPYTQGPYANPNNRFVAYPRPNYPYGRPYGYGYGGGMGVPLMGGLLGGMMLGGLMW